MTRLIDADKLRAEYQAILDRGDMFCEYNIIGMVDNAPTVDIDLAEYSDKLWKEAYERGKNERPHGKCKNCKAYRRYGSRADGYCNISRMTPEGETFINVNETFFCSYYKEMEEAENDKIVAD